MIDAAEMRDGQRVIVVISGKDRHGIVIRERKEWVAVYDHWPDTQFISDEYTHTSWRIDPSPDPFPAWFSEYLRSEKAEGWLS